MYEFSMVEDADGRLLILEGYVHAFVGKEDSGYVRCRLDAIGPESVGTGSVVSNKEGRIQYFQGDDNSRSDSDPNKVI